MALPTHSTARLQRICWGIALVGLLLMALMIAGCRQLPVPFPEAEPPPPEDPAAPYPFVVDPRPLTPLPGCLDLRRRTGNPGAC